MVSLFRKIINSLKPKKKVHIKLDEESVKKHHIVKAIANENASLKGDNAKLRRDLGEIRESEKDKEEDETVRWELNKKKKELEKKHYPKYFSLKSFFRKYLRDGNFRNKLFFYDRKRTKEIAKFGDIGFTSDGRIGLLDDNGVLVMCFERINDIFQSVGGLSNDVQTHKIPLNVNETGEYVENLEVQEIPEWSITPQGKFQFTKAHKRKIYDYITQLNQEVANKHQELGEKEKTISGLQKEVDDLKVSQKIAEDSSEISRSELSKSEKDVSAVREVFRKTAKELAEVRDIVDISEESVDILKKELEIMRNKAEREGTKLSFEDAIEKIDMVKSTIKQKTITPPPTSPTPPSTPIENIP